MINKYFEGRVPDYKGIVNDVDKDLQDTIASKIKSYEENMENLHFANAIEEIWAIIARANKYVDETAPWTLAKNEETEKLEAVMTNLVETLRIIAILVNPLMSQTSEKIFNQLGINKDEYKQYDTINNFGNVTKGLKVIEKGEPLFLVVPSRNKVDVCANCFIYN